MALASVGGSRLLQQVTSALETVAPLAFADHSWDNVGLLVEAPRPRRHARAVLLTIDLTRAVLQPHLEAASPVGVIVAYHPLLFKASRQWNLGDEQQRLALECAAAGISVYSPHTALDNAPDGINMELARGLCQMAPEQTRADWIRELPAGTAPPLQGGVGAVVEFREPVQLANVVRHIKGFLGLSTVRVAKGNIDGGGAARSVRRVAICAGSGASVLKGVSADVYWTGEMSHHDLLAAVARGTSVILCEHSNTERFYLGRVLKPRLQEMFQQNEETKDVCVLVSAEDRDPIEYV